MGRIAERGVKEIAHSLKEGKKIPAGERVTSEEILNDLTADGEEAR